jgi:hypothetical protein
LQAERLSLITHCNDRDGINANLVEAIAKLQEDEKKLKSELEQKLEQYKITEKGISETQKMLQV